MERGRHRSVMWPKLRRDIDPAICGVASHGRSQQDTMDSIRYPTMRHMLDIILRNLRCELTTGRTSYEYQATGFSEAGDTLEGSHCVEHGVFGSEIGHQTVVTRID